MDIYKKVKEAIEKVQGIWLIEPGYMDVIRTNVENFKSSPKKYIEDANKEPGSFLDMESPGAQDIMVIDGDTATMPVSGPLIDKHDCMTMFFGCTSTRIFRDP